MTRPNDDESLQIFTRIEVDNTALVEFIKLAGVAHFDQMADTCVSPEEKQRSMDIWDTHLRALQLSHYHSIRTNTASFVRGCAACQVTRRSLND